MVVSKIVDPRSIAVPTCFNQYPKLRIMSWGRGSLAPLCVDSEVVVHLGPEVGTPTRTKRELLQITKPQSDSSLAQHLAGSYHFTLGSCLCSSHSFVPIPTTGRRPHLVARTLDLRPWRRGKLLGHFLRDIIALGDAIRENLRDMGVRLVLFE
jgi:hypothetical protein